MKKMTVLLLIGVFTFVQAAFSGSPSSVKGTIVYAGSAGDGKGTFIFAVSTDGTGPGKLEEPENTDNGGEENTEPEKGIPLQVSFDNSPGIKEPVWSHGKKPAFVTNRGGEMKENALYIIDIQGHMPLAPATDVIGWSKPSWK
jgi:hypothetical protein